MQWDLKFCWELQNCLTASSHWELVEPESCFRDVLFTASTSLLDSWRELQPLAFKERLFCFHSPVTHTTLPVSSFMCPPHTMSPYSSSQSPQKAFSVLRISCINLKGGTSGSSSCLFCDINDYNAQWTIVTIINHQHLCNFWDETKTQKWTLMS